MRRASAIQKEAEQIGTIEDLTDVFESISSNQIAKIKDKVELSKQFFELLWKKYTSLRIDPKSQIISRDDQKGVNGKVNVFVIVSAEASLSGDIDMRLIESMLADYDSKTTDLVVLGNHGAQQLIQRNIPFVRYFRVPESDTYIDVSPVIEAIAPYRNVTVYYEEYLSLGIQQIRKLDLISSVRAMSEAVEDEEAITSAETMFEPSLEEIIETMELTMISLAFSQVILESSLAQDASRFNAMAVAKRRALEMLFDYRLDFYRAKRAESDRRLREVMVGMKRKKRNRA